MPNWCFTNLKIESDDKSVIDKIGKAMEDALSKRYLPDEPSYFDNWLGNLLCYTGMSVKEVGDSEIRCRGSVDYLDTEGDEIVMDLSTAWCPQLGAVKKLIEYLGISEDEYELIYTAEEPGVDLFCTNDPVIEGTYTLDDFESDTLYELSESEFRDAMTEKFGEHDEIRNLPAEKLISWAYNEFDSFSAHRFDHEDIDVWM